MAYGNNGEFHPFRLRSHLQRLLQGAGKMGFRSPWGLAELTAGIESLLEHLDSRGTFYIRPIVYRGAQHLWLTGIDDVPVDVTIIAVPVERGRRETQRLQLSPIQRIPGTSIPVQWKTSGSYVNSYLCRRAANAMGYDDGVMLDRTGRLVEASAANVFFLRGGELVTPALSEDVFPGITRATVLDLAREINLQVAEQDIHPCDLVSMDAAFISSTLLELRPVAELGGITFNSVESRPLRRIIAAFDDLTHRGLRVVA
jgi:branched-chain amino acid aminotransferase